MSKAANHQSIRREDFMKTVLTMDKITGFQPPSLPSLNDQTEDDDDHDESNRLQPLDINVLKDMIQKRLNKQQVTATNKMQEKAPVPLRFPGMRSRQSSEASIHSAGSKS